jgi:hypothetical protein
LLLLLLLLLLFFVFLFSKAPESLLGLAVNCGVTATSIGGMAGTPQKSSGGSERGKKARRGAHSKKHGELFATGTR